MQSTPTDGPLVVAIDSSTTATKAIVVDTQGPAPLQLHCVPDLAGVQRMLGELVYAVGDGGQRV